MAEGYSIAEAAKLLGVPQRRVMHLLEKGVLTAIVDDRRRWRVYLAASDATAAAPVTESDPRATAGAAGDAADPRPNGDPFSQLLIELRHLQERYGQALLALGEARGEAAALRSRVELLQGGPPVEVSPAEPGATPAAEPAPPPTRAPAPRAAQPAPPRQIVRRRRARPPGAAAGLAEALARADDPSPPELPGAREAVRAMDALSASQPSISGIAEPDPDGAGSAATPASADRGIARLRRWFGR